MNKIAERKHILLLLPQGKNFEMQLFDKGKLVNVQAVKKCYIVWVKSKVRLAAGPKILPKNKLVAL